MVTEKKGSLPSWCKPQAKKKKNKLVGLSLQNRLSLAIVINVPWIGGGSVLMTRSWNPFISPKEETCYYSNSPIWNIAVNISGNQQKKAKENFLSTYTNEKEAPCLDFTKQRYPNIRAWTSSCPNFSRTCDVHVSLLVKNFPETLKKKEKGLNRNLILRLYLFHDK